MKTDTSPLSQEELVTRETYARIAAERSRGLTPSYWLGAFTRFRHLLPTGRVLDVGCGSGRDAPLFIASGYDYVGVDLSPAMLDVARQAVPDGDFLEMDACCLDFADASFDGFWSVASLLHLPGPRLQQALREIVRVTKAHGIGFIVMKEGTGSRIVEGQFARDRRFFVFYGQEEFADLLVSVGLENVASWRDERPVTSGQPACLAYLVRKP